MAGGSVLLASRQFYQTVESNGIEELIRQRESNEVELYP